MPHSARRASTVLLAVLGLLASLVLTVATSGSAAAADDKGLANGSILFPQKDSPGIKMLWFDQDWRYLGAKSANGGGYSIWLPPGTYHLQFVDQRPAYDVKKYAPTDIQVTVRSNDMTSRNVRMVKGAVITGTAKADGKPLRYARVVAANTARQSFSTTANKAGQFAIGGLPQGRYSVFTYDKRKNWVDKSTWAGAIRSGRAKNLDIRLRLKAGSMTVYLFTPTGRLTTRTPVTVTNRKTGQWWTATATNGTAVFQGLYPGRYDLKFDGAGVWFARTGVVEQASVKPSRMAFGSFRVTKRGGWVTGTVVDKYDESRAFAKVTVQLFSAGGTKLDETTSSATGSFTLDGALRTQSGMTIVVEANADGGYLGTEPDRCQYTRSEVGGFSMTQGQANPVGNIGLERAPGQQRPQCMIPPANARSVSR